MTKPRHCEQREAIQQIQHPAQPPLSLRGGKADAAIQQTQHPAQPPLSLRATRSNPAPLSNNAFSQMPFLIHWIATAFGLAMTKPRHCDEAKPTWQSSQSNNPAQPPMSLRATRSNPAPLSNNAFGQMPFLIHWIATAFGLAMTKPRHCEERSDAAIQQIQHPAQPPLSLRGAQRRGNPANPTPGVECVSSLDRNSRRKPVTTCKQALFSAIFTRNYMSRQHQYM